MNISSLTQHLFQYPTSTEAWGLLVLRVVWGVTLTRYGLPMIRNPLHWLDLGGKPSGFPGFLQAIGAVAIFMGGLAITAGFLTPIAALGLAFAMAFALGLHIKHGEPFMKKSPDAPGETYEASLVYLVIALMFLFVGPGYFSVDALIFK